MGLTARVCVSGLDYGSLGWNLGLKARIWASGLEFGSLGWNMGLTARIWASGLEFGPQSWRGVEMEEKKKNSRKSVRWSAVPIAPM